LWTSPISRSNFLLISHRLPTACHVVDVACVGIAMGISPSISLSQQKPVDEIHNALILNE
jgi:hypothetical protein